VALEAVAADVPFVTTPAANTIQEVLLPGIMGRITDGSRLSLWAGINEWASPTARMAAMDAHQEAKQVLQMLFDRHLQLRKWHYLLFGKPPRVSISRECALGIAQGRLAPCPFTELPAASLLVDVTLPPPAVLQQTLPLESPSPGWLHPLVQMLSAAAGPPATAPVAAVPAEHLHSLALVADWVAAHMLALPSSPLLTGVRLQSARFSQLPAEPDQSAKELTDADWQALIVATYAIRQTLPPTTLVEIALPLDVAALPSREQSDWLLAQLQDLTDFVTYAP
jgi:hypothetical protein